MGDESESFLSARGGVSDSDGDEKNDGRQVDNNYNSDEHSDNERSTRSDQFWTPRDDGPLPTLELYEDSFKPCLMPKEFEKIFSKTRHGRHREVEEMFEEGAPVDGQDPYGNTVLHTACQNGNKRIVKICLRRGANTNAQNIRGHTPLHFCFAYGYEELGDYLIAKADADPEIRNHYGLTCREGLGLKTPLPQAR
uniref:Uncharacterized protein n=1 Tax=Guillardia theta TaxID=55529 RepID=A0A7S4PRI8_GUITH|mmetsp:Transcript_9592/g.32139  ORF Transcript_9592/g.32139 Transcript_9592/m.32139 type:complete len:195 (+) Transcript_9592:165-749(+)